MHDYLLSTEWVRFAFVCGIAVSMLLYERRHLTTGSIVVPGYIAVFLLHPLTLLATFVNAFVTYALVNKVLRRYVLLYGRTKFTVLAFVSTVIQTIMLRVTPSGPWLWERDIPIFVGVGYIVPALIAHDMARQGIMKTTKSVMMAGALVAIPIAIALVTDLPGVNDLSPVDGFGNLAFPVEWLPVAVLVSIVASWAVANNYDCRSGGFIGAAFVGMFLADFWQVVVAIAIATITYVIVAKGLMRHMILFGRRKFSAMLLTSSAIAWPTLWVGNQVLGDAQLEHVGVGSLALTPLLLPGLLANDVQRTAPSRVVLGVALAGMCTVTVTWSAIAVATGQELALVWKAIAVATSAVLLWPQITTLCVAIARRLEPLADAERMRSGVRGLQVGLRTRVSAAAGLLRDGIRMRPAVAPIATPAIAGFDASIDDPSPRRTQIDWSASWAAWANAHPDVVAEAQQWMDHSLKERRARRHVTVPDDVSIKVLVGAGVGGGQAHGRADELAAAPSNTERAADRVSELERTAVAALAQLLERSPASMPLRPAPTAGTSLRTPARPLSGIESPVDPVRHHRPAHDDRADRSLTDRSSS